MPYPSYTVLGEEVKVVNPDIFNDWHPHRLGKAWHKWFPEIEVDDEHHWTKRLLPIPGPEEALKSIDESLWGGMGQGLIGAADDFGAGITSGASLGLTDAARRLMGVEPKGGFAYNSGRMVGEIAGPYKMLRPILGSTSVYLRALKRFPDGARVVLAGAESGIVEGTKAAVQGENPIDHLASGMILGMLPEGLYRFQGRIVRKGVSIVARPAPGEIREDIIAPFKAQGVSFTPDIVRPESGTVNFILNRLSHTSFNRDIIAVKRGEMVEEMAALQNRILVNVGTNAEIVLEDGTSKPTSALGAGEAILSSIRDTESSLRRRGESLYQELSASEIGKIDIHPSQSLMRKMEKDGEIFSHEASLTGGLLDLVSAAQGKSSQVKKFKILIRDIVRNSMPYSSVAPEFGLQNPSYKSYDWWWTQLKDIGADMATTAVKKNPQAKALYARAYGLIQDVIDAQAGSISPEYDEIIKNARASWVAYRAFQEHPLVERMLKLEKGDPEKGLALLFDSTSSTMDAKGLLGSEAYAAARQSWLRKLLYDTTVKQKGLVYISGEKLYNSLKKHTDDIDSEYIREIFSDEGFSNVDGTPRLGTMTGGPVKLEMLMDLVKISQSIEESLRKLEGGQAMLGGGAERATPGMITADLASGGAQTKQLLQNILVMRKITTEFVADPENNIFMGTAGPKPLGDWMVRIPHGEDGGGMGLSSRANSLRTGFQKGGNWKGEEIPSSSFFSAGLNRVANATYLRKED